MPEEAAPPSSPPSPRAPRAATHACGFEGVAGTAVCCVWPFLTLNSAGRALKMLWSIALLVAPVAFTPSATLEVRPQLAPWRPPSAALAADDGGASGAAIGAGIAMGMAGLGCGIGQGLTAGNTTAGIARNPGAASAMMTNFILGMALIESIALIAFVTAILLMP